MEINLFIEGSHSHLKSLAGWGLIVTNENNIIDEQYGKLIGNIDTTRAELNALEKALEWIRSHMSNKKNDYVIVTDYIVIKKAIEGDSRRLSNRDYWDRIEPLLNELIANGTKIAIKHINSHTGNDDYYSKFNSLVDKLAFKGVNSLLLAPEKISINNN